MLPHPILMDSFWSDRNRLVQAAVTRQQHLDRIDETSGAVTTRRLRPIVRFFAALRHGTGRRQSTPAGASA